ncbi:MAG: hypothetical protein JWR75_1750 [Devosia sp.]|nr:hypothetical protein [Devosia sp.]
MPELDVDTARRIVDAFAVAIDGKPASAKTFSPKPFADLITYKTWKQEANNSHEITTRSRGLLLAYLLMSGGHIPYSGVPVGGGWFRPDAWVAGSLVKLGYATADDEAKAFRVTLLGWKLAVDTLVSALSTKE